MPSKIPAILVALIGAALPLSTVCAASKPDPWATLTIKPSWQQQTRIEFGTIRLDPDTRSEEHTSELQSLMRISYAVFCLKKKQNKNNTHMIISHEHITLN